MRCEVIKGTSREQVMRCEVQKRNRLRERETHKEHEVGYGCCGKE